MCTSITASRFLRLALVLCSGGMVFETTTCHVVAPGVDVNVTDDGLSVDFPGGSVDVGPERVFVRAPGVKIDLERSCD